MSDASATSLRLRVLTPKPFCFGSARTYDAIRSRVPLPESSNCTCVMNGSCRSRVALFIHQAQKPIAMSAIICQVEMP